MSKILDKFNQGRIPASRMSLRGDDMDCYAIMHFGLNTFTNREWGYGDESPEMFNPAEFNAEQIAAACKEAGLAGIILVCKHHDGFCLWPTRTTGHNITKSPFRNGKGDLVREVTDACRKFGLKVGFYVSPWDRNNAAYGTPEYLKIYREQLREIYSNYGPAFEAWFDGANGGDGCYGGACCTRKIDNTTYYDWFNTWDIVRSLQPDAAIFSDIGPDLRWVGNENGFADPEAFGSYTPVAGQNNSEPVPGGIRSIEGTAGHADGKYYIPPECDVPLRPGWFYHAEQDNALRSRQLLMQIYLNSAGNGGYMNIGIAPDRRGILHENDVKRLKEFHEDVQKLYADKKAEGQLEFKENAAVLEFPVSKFNMVLLKEDLSRGEQITGYKVEIRKNGLWEPLLQGKAVSRKRIKCFEAQKADALRITILSSREKVSGIYAALYLVPREILNYSDTMDQPTFRSDYLDLGGKVISGNKVTYKLPGTLKIKGFIYTPDTGIVPGTPDRFSFYADGVKIASGEFSNLRANPIPQLVMLKEISASEITFCAEHYLNEGPEICVPKFGVILA